MDKITIENRIRYLERQREGWTKKLGELKAQAEQLNEQIRQAQNQVVMTDVRIAENKDWLNVPDYTPEEMQASQVQAAKDRALESLRELDGKA
jgi:hypothetical protein